MLYLSTPSSAAQLASLTLLACLGLVAPVIRAFVENRRRISAGSPSVRFYKSAAPTRSYDSGSFRLRQECEPVLEPTLSLRSEQERATAACDPIDFVDPIDTRSPDRLCPDTLRPDLLFPDSDTSSYANVGRTTFAYLQQRSPAALIHLESRLIQDVGFTDAQIGEAVLALLFATGREYLPGILRYPIVTVEDLVLYITVSPHLEGAAMPASSARQNPAARSRNNAA